MGKTPATRGGRPVSFERLEGRQLMSATPVPAAVPTGSVKLTGTVLGTAGSFRNAGATIATVFDGNTATYFDGPGANGQWAGLDLGSAKVLTQLQFFPRTGWASRMVGGVFQGSTTADFSSGVTTLYTVTAAPSTSAYTAVPVTGQFEYVRYLSPNNGFGNVAEVEFDGVAATAPPPVPVGLAATASAAGVHLYWQPDATGATNSFTVERQGPTDAAYVVVGTTTGSAFDDATALPSTPYAYVVVANNVLGTSPPSTPVGVTTPAPFVNPWIDADIGAVGKSGSATVTPAGAITVTGGGADIWNNDDAFNYNYQQLVGNGTATVQVTSQTNTNGWAKSGIMIRESLRDDSRFVMLVVTPGAGVSWQVRSATHTVPSYTTTPGKTSVWLQVTRVRNTFTGFMSTDGVTWTQVGTATVNMVNNVFAGLAVCAHDNTKVCTATFANLTVTAAGAAASTWTAAATAPMSRWESETFTYGGKMYVFGGFIDRNLDATAECDAYDPTANAWSTVTTVPTGALTHAATTVVGDTAYFAGGDVGQFLYTKGNTSTAAVLTYDLTTGVWGSVASLPVAQSCGGLVCINNHLIYYGGLNATNTADLSTTWSLDLGNPSASWVAQAAMPDARNHLGAVTINGIAYAVGGAHLYNETKGNDAEVDAYDPVANVWTKVASLPMPWSSNETTTMVVNGKIVIVGGQTNGGYDGIYLSQIEAYDPVANTWAQVGTLPEANEGESIAYVNSQLIVAQGTVDNLGGWSQNQVWITSAITI